MGQLVEVDCQRALRACPALLQLGEAGLSLDRLLALDLVNEIEEGGLGGVSCRVVEAFEGDEFLGVGSVRAPGEV